jgi:hypothetical protein
VSEEIVNALLEDEGQKPLDPKYFAARVPTVYDEAIQWAKAEFNERWSSGAIRGPRHADETMNELASDACAEFELEGEDDEEEILTELFKYSAELVKGTW